MALSAFAVAVGSGALPRLVELYLGDNKISNSGMIALSNALDKGGLPELESLDLAENKIGDDGKTALSKAINDMDLSLDFLCIDSPTEQLKNRSTSKSINLYTNRRRTPLGGDAHER